MNIEWSPFALLDRDNIFDYIEAENSAAAIDNDERITASIENLAIFPDSGRPGRILGTRELIIGRTRLIAAYRVSGTTIRILRILHGAQLWPDALPD